MLNDEMHFEMSVNVPRWLGKLLNGPDYEGQGGTLGVAVSFPGMTDGKFDAGIYVQGHGGGTDYGTGHISVGFGYGAGDVQGMNGTGSELSFNDGIGGLSLDLDQNENISGVGIHLGAGINVGGAGTVTSSSSVRDLFDWAKSTMNK